jgi:hypothetical protein
MNASKELNLNSTKIIALSAITEAQFRSQSHQGLDQLFDKFSKAYNL